MSSAFAYVPLDPKGWRLAMGLRPLDLAQWLEVDEHRDEELALKDQLLARLLRRGRGDEPRG